MKRLLPLLFSLFIVIEAQAQITQTVIVEHFTNTRCGICASKNPGLFTNLQNHPDVLHIAYHPSSPYSSCILNQHNVSGNDGRTNFYGVYGSTPRLVIQGDFQPPATNFSSSSLFTSFQGKTTAFSMEITQQKLGSSQLAMEFKIVAVDTHSMTTANLFSAVAEDTIFYNAPNGESTHYNVFRQELSSTSGAAVNLPANGDSIVLYDTIAFDTDWNADRIFAYGILQESDKDVIQAAKGTESTQGGTSTSVPSLSSVISTDIYPNPTKGQLNVLLKGQNTVTYQLMSITGRNIASGTISNRATLDLSKATNGIYFLRLLGEDGAIQTRKIVKH